MVARLQTGPAGLNVVVGSPGATGIIGAFSGNQSGSPTALSCPSPTASFTADQPCGWAAYQAMRADASIGGGGLDCQEYVDLICDGSILFGPGFSFPYTTVCTGGAAYSLGTTQTLINGQLAYVIQPRSFLQSPGGDDTNNWETIPQAGGVHTKIEQYAIVPDKRAATVPQTRAQRLVAMRWLNFLGSAQGQAVLAAHGYKPIPTFVPIQEDVIPS